jgi:2-hydroxychromene-2-carboxylate isomerase
VAQPTVDFWFDFASTYSYPATMRVGALASQAHVDVRFRPFLLGPIFRTQGFETSPFNLQPVKGRYMWRDLERICSDLNLPFRKPDPFPQNSLLAARVALVGLPDIWGEDFCRAVFRAEFGDGQQIDDRNVIENLLRNLGLEPASILAAASSDAIKSKLRAETEEAQKLGLFGAPSFVTEDGELFWGNDRLEQALAWAKRRPVAALT